MKADLHIHSSCSDGSDTPEAIVVKAKEYGIGAIAVTDHDNVDGVERAVAAGRKYGVQVVPGLELSTYSIAEVHILGYDVDVHSAPLLERLERMRAQRKERIAKILDKLAAMGIKLDASPLDGIKGSVGRPHVARLLIEGGYATSVNDAFDRYLGEGASAYVPSKRITPGEGVKLIRAAGGVPVLAHPMLIKQKGRLTDLVQGLVGVGLGGIETYYPSHSAQDIAILSDIAKRNGLITTGGSDYHGAGKAGDIGCAGYEVSPKTAKELGIKLR